MENVEFINTELLDRVTEQQRIDDNTYFRDCAVDVLTSIPWLLKEIEDMAWAVRDPASKGYAFDKAEGRLIREISEQLGYSREYIDSLNPDAEVSMRISGNLYVEETFVVSREDYEKMNESKAREWLEPFVSHHDLADVEISEV